MAEMTSDELRMVTYAKVAASDQTDGKSREILIRMILRSVSEDRQLASALLRHQHILKLHNGDKPIMLKLMDMGPIATADGKVLQEEIKVRYGSLLRENQEQYRTNKNDGDGQEKPA